jgi:hypothetical protein
MFSSSRTTAVVVYPDNDKIGVFPGDEAEELIFKRGTAVPWAEGERAGTSPLRRRKPGGRPVTPGPPPNFRLLSRSAQPTGTVIDWP